MNTLHHILTLLLLTQTRTTNIPLFLLFEAQRALLSTATLLGPLTAAEASTTTVLLQFAGFFALGGNNAMSGVDLSSAYNGVGGFNVFAVGALIFVGNWAASLWWVSAGNLLLLSSLSSSSGSTTSPTPPPATTTTITPTPPPNKTPTATTEEEEGRQQQRNAWRQHAGKQTVFTAASVVAVMAACTALRTHLFIWTVFSPKYLYSMAWSLGMHLGGNVGLGGILFWLGSLR